MLDPHWLNLLFHSHGDMTVLAGLLGKLRCCKVHIHQARLCLEHGNLLVQDPVLLDLGEDSPVVKSNDGLLKQMEVSVVTPEMGMEPVGKGFEWLIVEGWCSKEVNDATIILTSCHGTQSCHSSMFWLFDEDSRTVPIWTGDSKCGESSSIILISIRAQQQLSINILNTLFESLALGIDVGKVSPEVAGLAVVYLLSLL